MSLSLRVSPSVEGERQFRDPVERLADLLGRRGRVGTKPRPERLHGVDERGFVLGAGGGQNGFQVGVGVNLR